MPSDLSQSRACPICGRDDGTHGSMCTGPHREMGRSRLRLSVASWFAHEIVANELHGCEPLPEVVRDAIAVEMVNDERLGWPTYEDAQVSRSVARPIHLPAVLSDQFDIPRSEARRRIALGRVKVNGEVVTDLDIPLPDTDLAIEMECRPLSDGLTQLLAAQQEAIDRGR